MQSDWQNKPESVGFSVPWGYICLGIFLKPTNQRRLKITAVINPDPLNTWSNVLPFIKMMTVMGSGRLGCAAVGKIYEWCNLAQWQCSNMVWHHPGAFPFFVCVCMLGRQTQTKREEKDLCAKQINYLLLHCRKLFNMAWARGREVSISIYRSNVNRTVMNLKFLQDRSQRFHFGALTES